jgi:hypothetical protein
VSSIIKDGVGKATRFLRTLTTKKPIRRQASIIFLGNQGQTVRNTGFAFSQDAGVSSAVSKSPEKYIHKSLTDRSIPLTDKPFSE